MVVRVGKSPLTFYTLPQQAVITSENETEKLSTSQENIIDTNFFG
jgi:hypothetical protein